MEHRRQETNMETRFMVLPETQAVVVGEGSRTILGYGIVFNRESEPLWAGGRTFREVILPEAVQGVDLRSMLSMHNHKSDRLLGNTRSGTMRVGVDSVGVWYETDLPDSPTGQDVLVSVSRRDTQGSSFQFDIKEGGDRWSIKNGMAFREVTKFNGVYEMGPVSEPAYPDTTIAKASLRSLEALEDVSEIEQRDNGGMAYIVSNMASFIQEANWVIGYCKRCCEMCEDYAKIDSANSMLYDKMDMDCDAAIEALKTVINTQAQVIGAANMQRSKRDAEAPPEEQKTDFQAIADDDFAFQQKQLLI